jgi:class 3 adenylate cyclase
VERTFTFVDLAGFSALTEAHGDETGADLVTRFVAMARDSLCGDGDLVAESGDAVFVASPSPAHALAVLDRLFRRAQQTPDFPVLRAGVHHGEAAARGGQFYGTAVNVAARVAAHARGGQVLGTAVVAEAARAAGRTVRPLGAVQLKNLRGEFELFALDVGDEVTAEAIDPVCRMRIVPERAAAHLELGGTAYWFCSTRCLQLFVQERA